MVRHCVQTAVSSARNSIKLKLDGVGELLTLGKRQAKLPLCQPCYNNALTQFFLVPNICALWLTQCSQSGAQIEIPRISPFIAFVTKCLPANWCTPHNMTENLLLNFYPWYLLFSFSASNCLCLIQIETILVSK